MDNLTAYIGLTSSVLFLGCVLTLPGRKSNSNNEIPAIKGRTRAVLSPKYLHPEVREALREASDHSLKFAEELTKERLNPIFSEGVDKFLEQEYSFLNRFKRIFDFRKSKEDIEQTTKDTFRKCCLSPSTFNSELKNIQYQMVEEYIKFLCERINVITSKDQITDAEWLSWSNDLSTLSQVVQEHREDPRLASKVADIAIKFGLAPSVVVLLHRVLLNKLGNEMSIPVVESAVKVMGDSLLSVFGIKTGMVTVAGKEIVVSKIAAGTATIMSGATKFVTGPYGITAYVIYTIYREYGKNEANKRFLREKLLESLERVRVSLLVGKDGFFYSTIYSLSNEIIKVSSERVSLLKDSDKKYFYEPPLDLYTVLKTVPEAIN